MARAKTEKNTIAASLNAGTPPPDRNVWQALCDPRLILLGLSGPGFRHCALHGINLWLPQIIQAMGFSHRATGFVAAVPYVVSMVAMIAWGRLCDARNKRVLDTALTCMLLAAAALGVASLTTNYLLVLVALTLAMAGALVA